MDTLPREDKSPRLDETASERQRRIAWEAERIAEARASLDAGFYVDAADVEAWIDSIGSRDELPLPPTRQRPI